MAKNDGKEFERATQQIFQLVLEQQAVHSVKVQHDVVLQGKHARHQIDVYWEYEIAGINYRTVVQCKDWSDPVKQEQIFAFLTVLNDLPGQPRGVFVSRSGFQSGAKDFADAHGIALYQLRSPDDENMAGLIQRVVLNLKVYSPMIEKAEFIADDNWVKSEGARLGIETGYVQEFGGKDVWLVDEAGNRKLHSTEIGNLLVPQGQEVARSVRSHDFPEPLFIETPEQRLPRVRVLGVKAEVEVRLHQRTTVLDASPFVTHVLQSMTDEKRVLLTRDGTIKRPDDEDPVTLDVDDGAEH